MRPEATPMSSGKCALRAHYAVGSLFSRKPSDLEHCSQRDFLFACVLLDLAGENRKGPPYAVI